MWSSKGVKTLGRQGVFASGVIDTHNYTHSHGISLTGLLPGPNLNRYCFHALGKARFYPIPCQPSIAIYSLKKTLVKWIVTHIDLWYAFTRRLGLGITRMEDIVLVMGCDLTRSSTNIAFLQGCGEARVAFGVHVTNVSRY